MLKKISGWTETRAAFFWVFGLSAAIKLLTLLPDPVINRDGVLYISAARLFSDGHFREALTLYPAPAYPLLIAGAHAVFPGGWVAAARLVSLTAAILVLIPLYLLIRRLFDREAAWWGCLAFSVLPFTNESAVSVIRGPAFLFLFAWAVYFAARAVESPRIRFFLWAGLLSWGAICFRIEGVVLPAYGILFFTGLALWAKADRRPFLAGLLTWTAVFLVPAVLFSAAAGHWGISGIRMDDVIRKLRHPAGAGLLDTYHRIYGQLKQMEQASPWPSGKENFAEIARRFMPLVYVLGVLHALVKVIFPVFVIPLIQALRRPFGRTRLFVLLLAAAYLLMLYCRLITGDFIHSRFLLAPVLLLFPWVGAGIRNLFGAITRARRPGLTAAVLGILFFVLPLYRIAHHAAGRDRVVMTAGRWLADRTDLHPLPMITNDARIPFYARKTAYMDWPVHLRDYPLLERTGVAKGMKLLALRTALRKKGLIPEFRSFEKIKEFTGKEDVVIIYRFREPGGAVSPDSRPRTGSTLFRKEK